MTVALRAGAWIETTNLTPESLISTIVALRAGAWIETTLPNFGISRRASRSVRARGLKPITASSLPAGSEVALRAGAWIETRQSTAGCCLSVVALRAGAWIYE